MAATQNDDPPDDIVQRLHAEYEAGQSCAADGLLNDAVRHFRNALDIATTLALHAAVETPAGSIELRRLRADAASELGTVQRKRRDLPAAETAYETALSVYQGLEGADLQQANTYSDLGTIHNERGDLTAAQAAYEHALALYQSLDGTIRQHANTHSDLGTVHWGRGNLIAAQVAYELALALYRTLEGTTRQQANTHSDLGTIHRARGDLTAAQASYEHAIALYQALHGTTRQEVDVRRSLAVIFQDRGELERAETEYERALALARAVNDDGVLFQMSFHFALLRYERAQAVSDPRDADRLLRSALASALEAALHADSYRCELPTERERLAWAAEKLAPRLELAFHIANRLSDANVVSDIIAHTRSSGILTLAPGLTAAAIRSADALDLPRNMAARDTPPPPSEGNALTAGISAGAGIGLDEIFRRTPVPALRMPDGRIALAREFPRTLTYA